MPSLSRADVEALLATAPALPGFEDSKVGANLHGSDLADADLSGLDLRGSTFHGADCRRADFSGCDLRGVNFHGALLTDAIFNEAKLDGANLCAACLCRVTFQDAQAARANLSEACAEGATGLAYTVDSPTPTKINNAVRSGKAVSVENGVLRVIGKGLRDANLKGLSELHIERTA